MARSLPVSYREPGLRRAHIVLTGLRYIDDLVLRRQDTNADEDYTDTSDYTHYALTDHQFSVVALIDGDNANIIERISYNPYGEARHHWQLDVDGDGDVDAADSTAVSSAQRKAIYQSGYNPDADFDRDGSVTSTDVATLKPADYAAALPPGWMSSLAVGNTVGFSGYMSNRESGLYTVRFRNYDPVWGRWLERDPAGYVDSMSLYGYGRNSPITTLDPSGLQETGIRLTFEFDHDDKYTPDDAIRVKSIQDMIDYILAMRNVDPDISIKELVIAAHGSEGSFTLDQFIFPELLEKLLSGKPLQPWEKDLLYRLHLLAALLADNGVITLIICEIGGDTACMLVRLLDPTGAKGLEIEYWDGKVWYSPFGITSWTLARRVRTLPRTDSPSVGSCFLPPDGVHILD